MCPVDGFGDGGSGISFHSLFCGDGGVGNPVGGQQSFKAPRISTSSMLDLTDRNDVTNQDVVYWALGCIAVEFHFSDLFPLPQVGGHDRRFFMVKDMPSVVIILGS